MIAPAHLQAMWQRTVRAAASERHDPPPRCDVRFTGAVEQRPLSAYAEASA